MQVHELIETLRHAPPDAHVVVGGAVVHGIEVQVGDIEIGYYNPQFRRRERGRERAIVFLSNIELSTGEVVSSPV